MLTPGLFINSAMRKILFKEIQQFRQWWIVILILAVTVPTMIFNFYALWMQNIRHVQVGNEPAPNLVYVVSILVLGLVIWAFFAAKLEVSIDEEGVHYRFFPFNFKSKIISKAEIQRYEIRKYSAIGDYGGWGIKRGFGRKWGKGYIVGGNMGLQLYLTNGKKVLFSTQRSQSIAYAMDEMMKK